MREKSESTPKRKKLGFAARLAKKLKLGPKEKKTLDIDSAKGSFKLTVGPSDNGKCKADAYHERPLLLEGVIRMHGFEYDVQVNSCRGLGRLDPSDEAKIFDRSLGEYLEDEVSHMIYQSLVDVIEVSLDDILERAKRSKS